jgi:1-deoxy-D-xylulose-5-phosphate reductoisomerase
MRRRRVAILGSTGSIGTQALDVIAAHPDRFEVVGLAAGKNVALLGEQRKTFSAHAVASAAEGIEGLRNVALRTKADVVLAATDGFVAFDVAFEVVERGIDLAVANKELIVGAGALLMAQAKRSGAQIIPVDSEHSAIFQCLVGEDPARIDSIVLTASGGPFWRKAKAELESVTLEQALAHPTWQMGVKNTIDSATMMNKGLEMIEAARLFGVPPASVHMLVHPQSIAHGAVIFKDASVKAQLAAPDMRVPIGYALAYPDRLAGKGGLDPLVALGAHPQAQTLRYDFERPDPDRFPCVRLAYEAAALGGTAPAVLSAANEVAVAAFVKGELGFSGIPKLIEKVMRASGFTELTLESVREADRSARDLAYRGISDPLRALH